MLYSHDGFGLGHFRRNLVIARALTERLPNASVLLACAAEGIETFAMPPGADVLRLPGLRKVDNDHYAPRSLRLDARDVVSLRAGLLAAAVDGFAPDVVLVDKHPLGLRGELLPALDRLREHGGRAALGLRDVLDDAGTASAEWRRGGIGRHAAELYDMALIYGQEGLLTPIADGVLPQSLAERARYCGYVVAPTPEARESDKVPSGDRPLVLATVGGGEDGLRVLEMFVEASRGARWRAIAVAGPQMLQHDWDRLSAAAGAAGVAAYQSVRQIHSWYRQAATLVCMGGYNTLVEALATPVPAVCIPRTYPRREQLIRARAFADLGLLQLLEPEQLVPAALAAAIETALATGREVLAERVSRVLDFGGARRAAADLEGLARRVRPEPGRVGQPVPS